MTKYTRDTSKSAALRVLRKFSHRTIVIVYDFDETLSPQSMQEYTVFPELGIEPASFWREVKAQTSENKATEVLTYMRMLAERIADQDLPIDSIRLQQLGAKVPYFPGVEEWFARIDEFVRDRTNGYVKVQHYIVSSGLKEILDGVSIAGKFKAIFASQYYFNQMGRPTFVDRVITDVSKTQYLFRINKGVEDLSLPVNEHMPEDERVIPFKNMIYIGDGDTDVPSMTVTRKSGGYALAVYKAGQSAGKCKKLYEANRINAYFEADYSPKSPLDIFVKVILRKMMAEIRFDSRSHLFRELVVE